MRHRKSLRQPVPETTSRPPPPAMSTIEKPTQQTQMAAFMPHDKQSKCYKAGNIVTCKRAALKQGNVDQLVETSQGRHQVSSTLKHVPAPATCFYCCSLGLKHFVTIYFHKNKITSLCCSLK